MTSMLSAQSEFVSVRGLRFYQGEELYLPFGANFWYGLDLGATAEGRARLERELDRMAALGINNLRVMAASEGPDDQPWRVVPSLQPEPGQYHTEGLVGLDHLLVALAERNMTAVLCLGNFWPWSGGFGQYLSWETGKPIPYPPPAEGGNWLTYMQFTSGFYRNRQAVERYFDHLRQVVGRVNSLTGQTYAEDPTIMAWQLANEPRGVLNGRSYQRWVRRSAALIKSLAPYHLVSIGSEGITPSQAAGTHFRRVHRDPNIDYATIHTWPENWQWYDPERPEQTFESAMRKVQQYIAQHQALARKLEVPMVLEEFGLARDLRSYQDSSSVNWRNRFYATIMTAVQNSIEQGDPLCGFNFWAWGGEGRPAEPGGFWAPGHNLIGDPPHEHQGWYSVYDSDRSTLQLLLNWRARHTRESQ